MKLLSLNLHCGMEENWKSKQNAICQFINEHSPDIICFQEAVQPFDGQHLYTHKGISIKSGNLVHDIIQGLDESYDWYFDWGKIGFELYEEGLAILSRVPLCEYESFIVSNSKCINNWKTRKIVKAKIKDLYVYNCHLGWWQDEEEPAKQQIDQLFLNLQTPALLVGDMNAPSGGPSYEYLMTFPILDIYKELNPYGFSDPTFIHSLQDNSHETTNVGQRIDYVFSTLPIHGVMTRVFTGQVTPIVSDHYGLFLQW